jgi:hypothetical protein
MATATTKNVKSQGEKKAKKDKSITGARTNVKGAGKNGKHATAPVRGSSTTYAPLKPMPAKMAVKLGDADTMSSGRADDGSVRISWYGHSITSILRWMGHHGANVAEGMEWAAAIGYSISPTTMNCQITSGRRGAQKGQTPGGFRGPLAELTAEQAKYLMSLRPTTK